MHEPCETAIVLQRQFIFAERHPLPFWELSLGDISQLEHSYPGPSHDPVTSSESLGEEDAQLLFISDNKVKILSLIHI